jgi:hypothetical protein
MGNAVDAAGQPVRGRSASCPPALKKLLVIRFSAKSLGLRQDTERREMVADALRADPAASDRSIGRRLGANPHCVATVRRELERAKAIPRVPVRRDARRRRNCGGS